MNILIAPFVNALMGLYFLIGNFGWAILTVTVLIRIFLLPLVMPSLKSAKKMRDLQPKIKEIQVKFKGQKEKLAQAQMELYKKEGINPLSGCLPQILQIAILLLFFSAFNQVSAVAGGNGNLEQLNNNLVPALRISEGFDFDTQFLGVDLLKTPSNLFGEGVGMNLLIPILLLVGSGVLQYFSSKLMMPAAKTDHSVVKKTEDKEDDMMSIMRTQSTYLMPLMTVFIGWNFSLGILLYWFVNSAAMLGQQVVMERKES